MSEKLLLTHLCEVDEVADLCVRSGEYMVFSTEHLESHQMMGLAKAFVDESDDHESARQSGETDYTDYTNDTSDGAASPIKRQADYTDYPRDAQRVESKRAAQ